MVLPICTPDATDAIPRKTVVAATESEDPNRAKERVEQTDPITLVSNTDNLLPSLALPLTLTADAKYTKLRTLALEETRR
jgi:hypothetical protein